MAALPEGECVVPDVQLLFKYALRAHKQGRTAEAETMYRAVLVRQASHADAWHLLGVVLQQQNQLDQALTNINCALTLEPRKAVYHNNRGAVLLELGRHTEAHIAFKKAVELSPAYADALSNLGLSFTRLEELDEASALFDRVLGIERAHVDTLQRYGRLRLEQGRPEEAVILFERALAIRPDSIDALVELGNAQRTAGKLAESAVAFRRALQVDSTSDAAAFNLGVTYSDAEMIRPAIRYFARAATLRPEQKLWKLREAACCPVVFQSCTEMTAYRDRLADVLDEMLAEPACWEPTQLLAVGCVPPFNMTHHGLDNRGLKERFARLFQPSFSERPRNKISKDKRRVGFIVTAGHESIFLRCMAPAIELLDTRKFEIVVFCAPPSQSQIRSAIRRPNLTIVGLSGPFERIVETILTAHCDLLHHWEIGTDPLNYFLAFERLGPVQFTSWGIPETSGISKIDYYLSCADLEAGSPLARYTERVWLLDSLLTYQQRLVAPPPADRADFGLPEKGVIYLCPQRLHKYHPDFDALIGDILRSDSTGRFVALMGRPYSTAELQRRFARTLSDVLDRVHFLPRQSQLTGYYRLLTLADVILDPPHYSAGSTCYDFLSLNLPVITLPGRPQASRYAAAVYNRMDLSELVPETPEPYVQLAVQIANDREFRQSTVNQLADRGDQIFGQWDYVEQLSTFLEHTPDFLAD